MSLLEIKQKSPSQLHESLGIFERKKSDIKLNGGNDFKLLSAGKAVKKRVLKKEILAYSNGRSLFINCFTLGCQHWYAEVESEGKYLVFLGSVTNSEAASAAIMGGAIGGAIIAAKRYVYLFNPKNSNLIKMTEETVPNLLNEHEDLAKRYMQSEDKTDLFLLLSIANELNVRSD